MTAEQLLSDYNHYRSSTSNLLSLQQQGKYVRELKATKPRLKAFDEMARWCAREGVDARLWLYSLFKARAWMFSPRMDQLIPRTEKTRKKALARYHQLGEVPVFHERIHREVYAQRVKAGTEWDVNRDLTNAAESLKRRYLAENDARRCLEEMQTRTFGYHPRSVVCARCPLQGECAAALQQLAGCDVIALRRGEITVDQARLQAWGGGYGRG